MLKLEVMQQRRDKLVQQRQQSQEVYHMQCGAIQLLDSLIKELEQPKEPATEVKDTNAES